MINISAVGDIFLGDYTISLGFGIRSSIKKFGFNYHFGNVKKHFSDRDIVFCNLETIISDKGVEKDNIKSVICRGEEDFIKVLTNAGFNMVNVSNNHILQHGVDAFHDTMEILRNNKIDIAGLKGEGSYLCHPIIKTIGGEKVGILGYSLVNENFHKGELLYASGKKEEIYDDIRKLKKETDYVIASCHWGIEFIDRPSINIQRLARGMVDAGASVVLGHHPHVVQGIERYNQSVIFYSLGNFLFDFIWNRRARESVIANISISGEKIDYELLPVIIDDSYQINLMQQKKSVEYIDYIADISSIFNDKNNYDIEDYHYSYYVESNKLHYYNQLRKIIYTLKNIYRLDKRFVFNSIKKLYKINIL